MCVWKERKTPNRQGAIFAAIHLMSDPTMGRTLERMTPATTSTATLSTRRRRRRCVNVVGSYLLFYCSSSSSSSSRPATTSNAFLIQPAVVVPPSSSQVMVASTRGGRPTFGDRNNNKNRRDDNRWRRKPSPTPVHPKNQEQHSPDPVRWNDPFGDFDDDDDDDDGEILDEFDVYDGYGSAGTDEAGVYQRDDDQSRSAWESKDASAIRIQRRDRFSPKSTGRRSTRQGRNLDQEDDDYDDLNTGSLVPADTMSAPTTTTSTNHFYSQKSLLDPAFAWPNATDIFQRLCQGAGISRPSRIQSLSWPVVMQGQHTIIADQTGSGKTLAYLLPLIQRALDAKRTLPPGGPRKNGAPRLLVLAPTAELADQIRAVCDKLSQQVSFSTMVVTATGHFSTSIRDQIRMLERQPLDVLISTPGRISTILRTRNAGLDLSLLQAIVLDEVDVLMVDETFGPQLRTVGAAAPLERTQFVFVTATLPDAVVQKVEREFPKIVKVKGPGLHRVAPTIQERLVDVSLPAQYNRDAELGFDLKAQALLKALRQTRCARTLIFCNTVESCRQVENLLNRRDRHGLLYDVRAYHNAMTPQARNENLAIFTRGGGGPRRSASGGARGGRPLRVDHILVCTDRAARGVDFEAAPVDHVIIFDFPQDPAEYVRRVGRTGRAGRSGTCTVLAYGWQLPIARSVMGSQVDTIAVSVRDNNNNKAANNPKENDNDEYLGGVQGRRTQNTRKVQSDKDKIIGGNISLGKLWGKAQGRPAAGDKDKNER